MRLGAGKEECLDGPMDAATKLVDDDTKICRGCRQTFWNAGEDLAEPTVSGADARAKTPFM